MTSKTRKMRFSWRLEEIHKMPEFGADYGWFYGLVRDDEGLHMAEIFPGMGYALAPPRWWDPRDWWMFSKDIWHTPQRKAAYGF